MVQLNIRITVELWKLLKAQADARTPRKTVVRHAGEILADVAGLAHDKALPPPRDVGRPRRLPT